MRCAVSESLSQFLEDQDSLESPEAPARARCSCGRFLPAWSSMPHCKACRDAYNARLLADIEAQIAKEKAHGEAIKALAVDVEKERE